MIIGERGVLTPRLRNRGVNTPRSPLESIACVASLEPLI
jgi:hypothetical protein